MSQNCKMVYTFPRWRRTLRDTLNSSCECDYRELFSTLPIQKEFESQNPGLTSSACENTTDVPFEANE